jgi:hypothetical protein
MRIPKPEGPNLFCRASKRGINCFENNERYSPTYKNKNNNRYNNDTIIRYSPTYKNKNNKR